MPVQVGDVEVLIETSRVAGTEMTSRTGDVAGRVVDAFGEVEAAIVALAQRVGAVVRDASTAAIRPSSLEVEFGLKVTAEGRVVVASAAAEASLVVKLCYDRSSHATDRE
jgi:hypothetical protein